VQSRMSASVAQCDAMRSSDCSWAMAAACAIAGCSCWNLFLVWPAAHVSAWREGGVPWREQ
jgi:hypothetical protein